MSLCDWQYSFNWNLWLNVDGAECQKLNVKLKNCCKKEKKNCKLCVASDLIQRRGKFEIDETWRWIVKMKHKGVRARFLLLLTICCSVQAQYIGRKYTSYNTSYIFYTCLVLPIHYGILNRFILQYFGAQAFDYVGCTLFA